MRDAEEPFRARLVAFAPESLRPKPRQAASEPSVLALQVAAALRSARLDHAVIQIREEPANWTRFLTELDGLLREDRWS